MPKIAYKAKKFSNASMVKIGRAIEILEDYERQGFDLTLRQLYYQFVARGLIPNRDREYKNLGNIVNDARLAGYIDWNHIVDRTRNLRALSHWDSPAKLVRAAASQFRLDKWSSQPYRVEVWIEKDALVGVIQGVCNDLDVPYFSCRGYTSQSEMWSASQRLYHYMTREDKSVRILHLGDHDPSGIDMTRDIEERLFHFLASDHHRNKQEGSNFDGSGSIEYVEERFKVDRLALNMDQIEQYDPPPNPAKISDSRARNYILDYGDESWELDALEPATLAGLIEDAILSLRDPEAWSFTSHDEERHRDLLGAASRRWSDVAEYLEEEQ